MESNQAQPETNAEQNTYQANQTSTTAPNGDASNNSSSIDFSENNVMAALSYVGPLVIIPFLTSRDNSFVMFHIKQGLVLLVLALILQFSSFFLFFLFPLIMLAFLGLFVLSIIGILNALKHKEVELPIVGKFAGKIKI
ncbi:MAG TPA: hypothetical protein PKA42_00605 [Candidatus Paceibacterota bacterium]|nr:hypothetical protein [Candidatus Paceibacterota bacterium]HMO82645.1 hypothetical protein [Candidatus Paceibacterota bacterium]